MTADIFSNTLGVILMGTGNDNNSWGGNANSLVFQIFEDAIANSLTSAVSGGTLDLSGSPPPAAASQVRYHGLIFTGVLGSAQTFVVPNLTKWWFVSNQTSGAFTLQFKTPSGSASTSIPQNSGWQIVQCDGANNIIVYPFNTGQIQMPDGSASAPPYSDINETNSGWYRNGTQDWRLAINGLDVFQVTGAGAGTPSVVNALSPNLLKQQGATLAGISGTPTTGHLAKWASATTLSDAGVASAFLDATGTGLNAPLNLSISATHTGANLLNVAVKTAAGADATAATPILVNFQTTSGSNTTGGITQVVLNSALSVSTSSTSATMGVVSATPFRLWIAIFNNAGTPVLALWHSGAAAAVTSIKPLQEGGVANTTGFSSGATSAGVWYTPNGTNLTNCAFRLIAYCEYSGGLTTAGNFTTDPTSTVLFGPGVRKPGDYVQIVNTSGTNSSSIAPTSAVNLVEYDIDANLTGTTAAGIFQMNASGVLKRAGVAVQTSTVTMYGSAAGQSTATPIVWSGIDNPASGSALTYAINGTGNFAAFGGQLYTLKEIMG